jgi:transposase
VVVDADGDLTGLAAAGLDAFTTATRAHLARFGACRPYHRIVRAFFTALTDPAGVTAQRPGALERVGMVLADWQHTKTRLADVEARMTGILDALGLTALLTSIPGLSAVGAAVILAETGDLSRFATARSVVKHAGLSPTENTSATFRGQTRLSRRGRPGLRLAAWRAVWGALPHNPVLHAKLTHLTRRDTDRLAAAQAHAACAAALLRWLHAIVTRRQPFNPDIATGQHRPDRHTPAIAA